jgi:hypothetical protein
MHSDGSAVGFDFGLEPTPYEIDAYLASRDDLAPDETRGVDERGGYIASEGGFKLYEWLRPEAIRGRDAHA